MGLAASVAVACGEDDEGGGTPPAGQAGGGGAPDGSGTGGTLVTGVGGEAAPGASGAPEAGATNEGGSAAAGAAGASSGPEAGVVFQIPVAGGEVEVPLPSGNSVAFAFPASAAGTTVTLKPAAASSVGWPDAHFQDVILMEPDGQTFDEPVLIRPSTGGVLAFDFASSGAKSPAEGLALSSDGQALELQHFSTLVIVPPDVSCDSTSGWQESPNDASCSEHGAASSRLSFVCKAYSYCLLIDASCCAPPGSRECALGMPALTLSYTPTDTAGVQYGYCDRSGGEGGAGGAGAGGAGAAGAGAGGAPADAGPSLSAINPSTITAGSCPRTVELVGSNFDPAGTGFVNLDSAVTTTFNSSTSATITIDSCPTTTTITGVGYVNPAQAGGYDWPNRSNMLDITVDGGACFGTGSESGPTGSGTCNDPYVLSAPSADAYLVHTASSGSATWDGVDSACGSSPARTDIYRVNPYQYGWQQIEVSVDAISGGDAKISFFYSDIACNTEDHCVDVGGTNACEVGSATQAQLQTGAIFFAVTTSGVSDTVTTRVHVH